MSLLIPVIYRSLRYPEGITATIREIPAHLDVTSIGQVKDYSLHTEYSSPQRRLNSHFLQSFQTLRTAHLNGVPKLWFNLNWAKEFAGFVQRIVGTNPAPRIIEIHPPYKDSCPSIEHFCAVYRIFEGHISSTFPKTEILIENRFGTRYPGSKFLISSCQDLVDLVSHLEKEELHLGLVVDFPQLFSNAGDVPHLSPNGLKDIFETLKPCRTRIKSFHLWGKRRLLNGQFPAHIGNLDTYFEENQTLKQTFLKELHALMNDGLTRYFVPEVNSGNQDLASIINDLISTGFIFQGPSINLTTEKPVLR